jgi:rhodanese-related sulfurtransferase
MNVITTKELKKRLDRGEPITLVEVLSAGDFDQGHLPGAINIPSKEMVRRAPEALPDKGDMIVCYCAGPDCEASGIAAEKLEKLGYTNVWEYSEGKEGWEAAGLGLEHLHVPAGA